MMDCVVPGGARSTSTPASRAAMRDAVRRASRREVAELRSIYDEHAGLQDRFVGTGQVAPELAAQLGLTGLAGRASGQAPTCAWTTPGRPTTRSPCALATPRAATSRRGSPCASSSCSNRCA